MSDEETLGVYARKAADYASLTKPAKADRHLAAFLEAVPQGGRILDLGCGPGYAAKAMAEAGRSVLATDAVAEMVALAAQHPGVEARQQSFDGPLEADGFHGIWANFSLLHAPRAAMQGHLGHLHKALKSSGIFHIGMKLGTGSKRDSIGRLYTYYTEEELVGLLEDAGLRVTDRSFGRDVGLDGTEADWICLLARG
ncbi:MAG: class I SAM-dependent methyltransferase [Pseudomonadota bacterium]